MKLSARIINRLETLGILLCKDLMGVSIEFLLDHFNEKNIIDIKSAIRATGLKPPWAVIPAITKPVALKPVRKRGTLSNLGK
jgi:hypothetical protein